MHISPARESRERVRVALHSLGIRMPASRITVSFSPADIPKRGFVPDLPVAIGILICLGHLRQEDLADTLISGELGLSGEVRTVRRGTMLLAEAAAKEGIRTMIVPEENTAEAAIAAEGSVPMEDADAAGGSVTADGAAAAGGRVEHRLKVIGVRTLRDCIEYLSTRSAQRDAVIAPAVCHLTDRIRSDAEGGPDFSEVHGQKEAKRALEIAAAGFHNILMTGPPGAGKSMLASRLPGILPPLSAAESMEVTEIYSVAGMLDRKDPLITRRPFLAPHHTVTGAALTGGGEFPLPGLISQAHRGVLFLDELPEFRTDTVNLLRQPMEERQIRIVRRSGTFTYPARFLLCAAANPCPCGYWPDRSRCRCSDRDVARYRNRIPGPLLDRIDLCITLRQVEVEELTGNGSEESSRAIRERVMRAAERQRERFGTQETERERFGTMVERQQERSGHQPESPEADPDPGIAFSDAGQTIHLGGAGSGRSRTHFNGDMLPAEVERYCVLGKQEKMFAENLFRRLRMSARGFHRLLKVARTIADLEGEERILVPHLAEAAAYRFRYDATEML